jgi:hypothetical protein
MGTCSGRRRYHDVATHHDHHGITACIRAGSSSVRSSQQPWNVSVLDALLNITISHKPRQSTCKSCKVRHSSTARVHRSRPFARLCGSSLLRQTDVALHCSTAAAGVHAVPHLSREVIAYAHMEDSTAASQHLLQNYTLGSNDRHDQEVGARNIDLIFLHHYDSTCGCSTSIA